MARLQTSEMAPLFLRLCASPRVKSVKPAWYWEWILTLAGCQKISAMQGDQAEIVENFPARPSLTEALAEALAEVMQDA